LTINILGVKRELLFPVSGIFLGVTIYTSLTLCTSLGLHLASPGPSPAHSQDALTARRWLSADCQSASAPVTSYLAGSISGCSRQVCLCVTSIYSLYCSSTAEIAWR